MRTSSRCEFEEILSFFDSLSLIEMSTDTDTREWHYCDVLGGTQKGPVPAVVLCRLLEKGAGVSPQTLIWKVGMESWLPMSAVRLSYCIFAQCS